VSTAAATVVDGRRTDTRDRLVASALELFAEHGYEGTSVAQIEAAVGLRPGAGGLYRHFPSKEELLVVAVSAYRDRVVAMRAELAAAEVALDVADDLRQIVSGLIGFLRGERTVVRLSSLGSALPLPARLLIGDAWDEAYGIIVDLIERRGADVEDPAVVALECIGSLDHYFTHVALWKSHPLDVDVDRFLASWTKRWAAVLEA
jgi:AcrR family transcriptional regulator